MSTLDGAFCVTPKDPPPPLPPVPAAAPPWTHAGEHVNTSWLRHKQVRPKAMRCREAGSLRINNRSAISSSAEDGGHGMS